MDGSLVTASVIVPAWNEAARLSHNLGRIVEALREAGFADAELVVVDDGSTDATWDALRTFAAANRGVRAVRHETNLGIAAAVATGFAASSGATIAVADADLSYDPACIVRLLEVQRRTRAGVVVASPYMPGGSVENVPFVRRLLSRAANAVLALADHGRARTYTGIVRSYDRFALARLLSAGPASNERLLLAARRAGIATVEVPATLRWPADRGRGRLKPLRIAQRVLAVFACTALFVVTP